MAKQADLFPTTSTPVALPEPERQRIEDELQSHLDAAERLISRLDESEPDPDLEDNGDAEPDHDGEASLGWTGSMDQNHAIGTCRDGGEDMEAEHDGREPDEADFEPSLGASNPAFFIGGLDQTHWGRGATDDREQECEDEGACETALAVL